MKKKYRFILYAIATLIIVFAIREATTLVPYLIKDNTAGNAEIDKSYQTLIDGIYLNPELVDEKPDMSINKQEFLEKLNLLLPPKMIFERFGSGYHEFRFELGITKNGKLGSILIKKETDSPISSTIGDFLGSHKFVQTLSEIKYKPAVLDRNNVASILVMTLFIAFDKNGNVTYPWYMNTYTSSGRIEFFDNAKQYKESEIISQPEIMPEMIGGPEALSKNIVYPILAKKAGIEGKVIVAVVIDESGEVIGSQVIRGLGAGLNEAAISALRQTKFHPGKLNGKAVKVKLVFPIVYKLQ